MASPTYSFNQIFANLGVGAGEVAALRVDAVYINALATDITRAVAVRMSCGDKALDSGSGLNQTIITLRSDSNRTGVIKAGDYFVVVELATGSTWEGICSVDDIISFSTLGVGVDGRLYEGAAPANYAAPAFIDDLRIEIRHQRRRTVQMQELNLNDGDYGALQTDNVLRPGGAVLETDMAANEATFLVAHTAAGNHDAGVIETDDFADDAFETFNYDNLLANGGAEAGETAAGEETIANILYNPPFYWEPVAGREPDALYLTNLNAYEGRYCGRVDFSATNQAVDLYFNPLDFDVTQHRGKYVALSVAVHSTQANGIQVGFNGAIGGETLSAAGGAAGAYTILTHVAQIDAAETGLTVRSVNAFAGANVTYLDAAITVFGTKPVAYKRGAWEADAIKARNASIFNLALNYLFSYWTNGVAADPDCWESWGGATCIQEAAPANVARGDYSGEISIPNNASGFRQLVGYSPTNRIAEALRERYVTAKFKVKWIAGTRNLHVTLLTDVPGNSQTIVVDLPRALNFTPCANIAFIIDPAATNIYLQFENLDAGVVSAIDFYLDDVQITPTPWPCAPIIPSYYEIETLTWTYAGLCDPSMGAVDLAFGDVYAFATNNGINASFYGIPLRSYVEVDAVPAIATQFDLLLNGGVVGSITVTNPATEAQAHVNVPAGWSRVLPADNLMVRATNGGSAIDDPVVRWVFLKCAANTSEV